MVSDRRRITADEIRKDLGVSRATVYRMLDSRIIPNVRTGRVYIIGREAYERWLRNCGMPTRDETVQ